ncbi:tetratricopeptide repeat protein [Gluconacetobacter asukensis]|uniref:Tetratricopeptide repeat protein n=1 Tax=Gluconacetobacter asukensis TaxID=1017181 RepID=A0A7W4IYZ0_9PROT|nr:tetratricopeptide repeat protein [Gluconacetobacter asukensis]MBB2171473.1 tetratricopeptide repeat protein [Gluconacetobacter asukensis]
MGKNLLIAQSDMTEAFFLEGETDFLLITFNHLSIRANGSDFWGRSIAEKAGFNCLGFMSKTPHWFPRNDRIFENESVKKILDRFSTKIIYGHSMGGHAALKHSNRLGASVVICFSPQYSIDPSITLQNDTRFHRRFNPSLNENMSIIPSDIKGDIFVFTDQKMPQDRFHVDLLRGVTNFHDIVMPYAGHETVQCFAGTSKIITLIDSCLSLDYQNIRRMASIYRRSSIYRKKNVMINLSRKLARSKNFEKMIKLTEYMEEIIPHDPIVFDIRSNAYLRMGIFSEALSNIEVAIRMNPQRSGFYKQKALVLERIGDLDEALKFAEIALSIEPHRDDHKKTVAFFSSRVKKISTIC